MGSLTVAGWHIKLAPAAPQRRAVSSAVLCLPQTQTQTLFSCYISKPTSKTKMPVTIILLCEGFCAEACRHGWTWSLVSYLKLNWSIMEWVRDFRILEVVYQVYGRFRGSVTHIGIGPGALTLEVSPLPVFSTRAKEDGREKDESKQRPSQLLDSCCHLWWSDHALVNVRRCFPGFSDVSPAPDQKIWAVLLLLLMLLFLG